MRKETAATHVVDHIVTNQTIVKTTLVLAVSYVLAVQTASAWNAPAKAASIPGISAQADQSLLTFVDPKTGVLLWKAHAKSFSAQSGGGENEVVGTLTGVHGTLYLQGKQADSLTAQTVTADNAKRLVTATGGVVIVSLTQANTSLRCDKAVWSASNDQLIGSGHVVFHKAGFTQTGPSFAADTRLKKFVMPAPGARGGPVVHATY